MALSDILTKIQNFVNAKAVPNPDPARVSAAELSEVLTDIAEFAEEVSDIDIARSNNDRGLMTNYDVRAITEGIIPVGADTTEITWLVEPVLSTEVVEADAELGIEAGFNVIMASGASMEDNGTTYTHTGTSLKAFFYPAETGSYYIGQVFANHLGGSGANEVSIFSSVLDDEREYSGAGSTFDYPTRILVARVKVFEDSIQLLPGAQVKRLKDAAGNVYEADQFGTVLIPNFGTGGGSVDAATETEEIAGTVTDKASTPGGRSAWWASVVAGATTYFSQKLAALKIELGSALEEAVGAVATRYIELKGYLPDISLSIKFKGNGKLKLDGLSYLTTDDKILVINSAGEVVAQYLTTAGQVGVPATLTSPGIPGTWAFGGGYFYRCVGPAEWIKIPGESEALQNMEMMVSVPALPTSPGFKGQEAYDPVNKLKYKCEATNTWIRWSVQDTW